MPDNKHLRFLLKLLYAVLIALAIWLLFKYLFPWSLPFIIAFSLAALTNPLVSRLAKKTRLSRGASSALVTTAVLLLFFTVVTVIITQLLFELGELLVRLPDVIAELPDLSAAVEEKLFGHILAMPASVQAFLGGILSSIRDWLSTLPAIFSGWLVEAVSSFAAGIPNFFVFLITTCISTYFMSGSYNDIKAFIMRCIPKRFHRQVRSTKGTLQLSFFSWLRVQLILTLITFAELAVALLVIRVDYPLIMAAVTALVDLVPLLGTGIILIPWAIFSLMRGRAVEALSLVLLHILVNVARRVIEPKLLSEKLGLHPLVSLIAVYIGYKALGVVGMICLPFVIIMLKQLQEQENLELLQLTKN